MNKDHPKEKTKEFAIGKESVTSQPVFSVRRRLEGWQGRGEALLGGRWPGTLEEG